MLNLNNPTGSSEVTIIDFNIPFWSLVKFLVKLAFASIPAFIIIIVINWLIIGALVLIGGGLGLGINALMKAKEEPAVVLPSPTPTPPRLTRIATPLPTATPEATPTPEAN